MHTDLTGSAPGAPAHATGNGGVGALPGTPSGLVVRTRSGDATPISGASPGSALAEAADRRAVRWRSAWIAGLVAALLVPQVVFVLPAGVWKVVVLAGVVVALASFWVGLVRYRPRPVWPWAVLGVGLAVRFLGMVMRVLNLQDSFSLLFDAASLVTLAAVPLIIVGVRGIIRRSGPVRTHRIVDALAITYSVGTVLWGLVVVPYLHTLPRGDRLLAFLIILGDYSVLAMAVMIALVAVRHVAHVLVGAALFVFLAGDIVFGLAGGGPTGSGTNWDGTSARVSGVTLLVGYGLMALAASHPSVAHRRSAPAEDPPAGRVRTAIFGAITFAYPVFILVSAISGTTIDPLVDIAYPAIMTTVFSVYLAVRSAGLAREAYERAREQASQAAALGQALGEQQTLQRQLAHRAMHDPLTGLANRAKLTEALDRVLTDVTDAMLDPAREVPPFALLLIDLDGFKDVNDTHGHPVGDELLVAVASRFVGALPTSGVLARLGGDEFAVLLAGVDLAPATAAGNRMAEALREPFRIAGHDLYLTASVGLYVGLEPATPSDVLRNADLALYSAKAAGKNQVIVYRPELRAAHLEHVEMLAGLRRAVAVGEFVLEYQPVVDLVTEKITSVEALLRWHAPGQGVISPVDFIPIAEESGLIVPIGAWVLGQACVDTKEWYDQFGIAVAVNVAARQLRDPEFPVTVLGALRYSGLPAEALVLEITESTMIAATMAETEAVVTRLEMLRARGVRIAIDDFGTGYSSLSYLRRLPVDILKIDRAFSQDGPDSADSEDTALTRAILQLSHSLGLSTVAEGVETAERASLLRELRCDRAQGFLYSRPVAASTLDQMLAGTANPFAPPGDSTEPTPVEAAR